MKSPRCPRCGRPIPRWQPIHFQCLLERARNLILARGAIAFMFLLIVFFSLAYPYINSQRGQQNGSFPLINQQSPTSSDFVGINKSSITPIRQTATILPTSGIINRVTGTSSARVFGTTITVTPTQESYKIVSTTPVSTQPLLPKSPEDLVMFYYNGINSRQYELTWSLLSEEFKDHVNGPQQGGYQGYVDWWNTVEKVSVTQVSVIQKTSSTASLKVKADYYYKSGVTTHSNLQFNFTYDNFRQTWLFDW